MSAPKSFRLPNVISFLAALGLALAFISLFHHTAANNGLDTGKSAYCNISATVNCDAVNLSPYSYLFGVPIASYGVWFYAALLLFSFLIRGSHFIKRETAVSVSLVIGIVSVLVSIVLFLISEVLIHVLCPVCIGMYAVNLLLLASAVVAARGHSLAAQIGQGAVALLRAPLAVFASPSPETFRSSALITLFLILSAYCAITLPDVILVRLLLPSAISKNEDDVAKTAVKEWSEAPQLSIPLSTEGSVADVDFAAGDPAAPIQIVEFSDFECPFCRQLSGELDALIAENQGKVRFAFRNFPLDNSCNPEIPKDFHHNSCEAAIFARCAGEQGKFWDAVSYLFTLEEFDRHADKETVSKGIARGIETLSLDRQAIEECTKSGRPTKKIAADIEDASKAGLQGTPFIVINGKQVKTPTPKALRAIFDFILKR